MRQSLSRKFHPKTGARLHPIYTDKHGRHRWPILGASEDDDSNDGDDGDGTDDSSEDDGADDQDDKDKHKGKDPRVKELSDEAAARRVANKKLQTELDEAKKALKEIEDKDKTEVERLTAENVELKAKLGEKDSSLRQRTLDNAFLASDKHSWANPETALKLADLSEVEIDEDGKVTGLDKALDKLAKSDPYLLKKDDGNNGGGAGSSGGAVGSGKEKDKGALDREKLQRKYRVLR